MPGTNHIAMPVIVLRRHWSDCALSSIPAHFPKPCTCGGFERPEGPVTIGERIGNAIQYLQAVYGWINGG